MIVAKDGGSTGSLGGGDADKMRKLIAWMPQLWTGPGFPSPNYGDISSPPNFVLTDKDGNPTLSPHLQTAIGQLGQMYGWQGELVGDLKGADNLSQFIGPAIKNAIKRRTDALHAIAVRIRKNMDQVKKLQEQIKANQTRIKDGERPEVAVPDRENDGATKRKHCVQQGPQGPCRRMEQANQDVERLHQDNRGRERLPVRQPDRSADTGELCRRDEGDQRPARHPRSRQPPRPNHRWRHISIRRPVRPASHRRRLA